MTLGEIAHRVREKARQAQSRRRHEGWARFAGSEAKALPGLRKAILMGSAPRWGDTVPDAAAVLLRGEFAALGIDWPARPADALFPPELWRLDPVSGKLWPGPDTYTFDIDFRAARGFGDVKYVWEINRLQFLQVLALRALLSGDPRSIDAIDAAVASWHEANPPFRGLGWASGIEVALRAISLMVALSLAGDRLSTETRTRIGEIFRASAFWLRRFPSLHSSANNHYVAELAGRFLLTQALGRDGGIPRAALLDEIVRQILPDGVAAEQTPTYGAFTVELALLCAFVARAGGTPFPPAFDDRIAAFAEWIGWLGGGGQTAAIGDDDEGRALSTIVPARDYPRSVTRAIGGYLRRALPSDDGQMLLAAIFPPPHDGWARPEGLRTFADGGYSIWAGTISGHAASLVFDHGPLGYLSIAAHGHADALAVQLSVDGRPVLVDPGTYLYGSGGPWRPWFRSTAAHNTLNLDGADQSLMAGPFNWSEKAVARLTSATTGEDWQLTAEHDGYRRRFGVVHERCVAASPTGFEIRDRLRGGEREAELVFQLAAGLTATVAGSAVSVVSADGRDVLRIVFPTAAVTVAVGGDDPGTGGWVSPRFGEKIPAPRLAWRGLVGEARVTTLLEIATPHAAT